jgi:hypothetical protein
METIAVTPEQGRQIVRRLDDLERQLFECFDKWMEWEYENTLEEPDEPDDVPVSVGLPGRHFIDIDPRKWRKQKSNHELDPDDYDIWDIWSDREQDSSDRELDLSSDDVQNPELKFLLDRYHLGKLADQVKAQVEQGHVEKQLLIEFNKRLGKLQEKYGDILVFSATIAAIISGLKDLIELLLGQ